MAESKNFSAEAGSAKVVGTVSSADIAEPVAPPMGLRAMGPRITFHFVGEWNAETSYVLYDVVRVNGTSYIANKINIAKGINPETDNNVHWVKWNDPNAQVELLQQTVNGFDGRITEVETEAAAAAADATAAKKASADNAAAIAAESTRAKAAEAANAESIATANEQISAITAKNAALKYVQLEGVTADNFADVLQTAINAVRAEFNDTKGTSGKAVIIVPPGTYNLNKTVIISPFAKITTTGRVTINSTAQTAFWFTHSAGDYIENTYGREEWYLKPWISGGFTIINNGIENAVCFEVGSREDLSTNLPTSRYTLEDFIIKDFTQGILLNPINNYMGTFSNFRIINSLKNAIKWNDAYTLKNAGERFTFKDFVIEGSQTTCLSIFASGFQADFANGSFDYVKTVVYPASKNNIVTFNQCHAEGIGNALVGENTSDNSIVYNDGYIGISNANGKIAAASVKRATRLNLKITNTLLAFFGNASYGSDDILKLIDPGMFHVTLDTFRHGYNFFPVTVDNNRFPAINGEGSSISLAAPINGYTFSVLNLQQTADKIKIPELEGHSAIKFKRVSDTSLTPSVVIKASCPISAGVYGIVPLGKNLSKSIKNLAYKISFDESESVTEYYYQFDASDGWNIPTSNTGIAVPEHVSKINVEMRLTFDYQSSDFEFGGFFITEKLN